MDANVARVVGGLLRVAGGGVALVRAQQKIEGLSGDNEDQNVGINIALRAMEAPIRQITNNAGEEASVVLDKIKEGKENFLYACSLFDESKVFILAERCD